MISDVLEDIDAAVGQRCACLCGAPISEMSPSAYFASEGCSRWWYATKGRPFPRPAGGPVTNRPQGRLVGGGPNHHLVVFDEAFGFGPVWTEVRATYRAACAVLTRSAMAVAAELASQFRERVSTVVALGRPAGEEVPADPLEHALWLRRRRNTGPTPAARVPRQVGPVGGLRSTALGRRPYQPPRG